jgi:DNA-binding transcriptional ArsR family regulator
VSRPAVSQHLRVLERAKLVSASSNGTRRIYEVETSGLDEVRTWFDTFWSTALDRFAEAAEREATTDTKEDDR